MSNDTTDLARAKYVSLRSYKKDGTSVDTPVWFAMLDGKLVVFTDGTSYKVKRIRRNPAVQIATCDARGQVIYGAWLPGRCRPVEGEPQLEQRAYALLNQKYGLMMRMGTFFSTLVGRVGRRLILEITLENAGTAATSTS